MVTSGSTDFTRTRNQIIKEAYQLLGVYGADETIGSSDQSFAEARLNGMIKSWQAMGINLWAYDEGVLFLTKGTAAYSLGGTGDEACLDSDFVGTTLSAAEASGQTVISVTSSTGMTASDVVLIEQDDKTLHSTTIVSVDSATQITITAATTAAASSGNQVFTYTTIAGRPLRIHNVRRRDTSGNEIPLTALSRQEYFELANKSVEGIPSHYCYEPKLTNGKLYLYLAPDSVDSTIRYSFTRSFEDFDNASDNPDFPQEWIDTITYNLSLRMAPAFGKHQEAAATIAPIATSLLESLRNYDSEITSVYLTPQDY